MNLTDVYEKELVRLNNILQCCGYFPSEEKTSYYKNLGKFKIKKYMTKELPVNKHNFIEIYLNEECGVVYIKHELKIQKIKEFLMTEDKNYINYISYLSKLTDYLSRKQKL